MVSRDEVIKIAALSKLQIDEDQLDGLTKDMSDIIGFADTINQIEKGDSNFDNIHNLQNVFREDEAEESYDRELILKSVDGGDNGYFVIKRRQN